MMLLDDIRTFLVGLGLVTVQWPLYEGFFPDDQNQMASVFETGGHPPQTLNREYQIVKFQLRVRGNRLDYVNARAQWQAMFNALQDSTPTSSYAYIQAVNYGPIMFNDDKGRPNLISNFNVMKLSGS